MASPSPPGGWDFSPRDHLRDIYWRSFGTPVHFSSYFSPSPFRLVVDVPQSAFRLDESSLALALRACLWGSPADFYVHHIRDHCFSFLFAIMLLAYGFTSLDLTFASIINFVSSFGVMVVLIGNMSYHVGRRIKLLSGQLLRERGARTLPVHQ